jgi:hypothetical protein
MQILIFSLILNLVTSGDPLPPWNYLKRITYIT